jgi:hypothetical protein
LSLFGFEIRRYLRGFLLLAIATAVFSLVNLALSAVPDTVVIGGDLGEICGNATTTAPAPTPTPTPTPTPGSNITNINFYDPFDTLSEYWVRLTHPWTVTGGYVRTTVDDASYNNAIYYIVDFIEPGHDTIVINTRVKVDYLPGLGEWKYFCAFLSTIDLDVRVLGCIDIYVTRTGATYVYGAIRVYRYGSVTRPASTTIESTVIGIRHLSLTVVKLNETHVNISLSATRLDGTPVTLSPVTVMLNWSGLGYFGLYMSHRATGEGFDFIDVWITSVNATSTVYYNVNFPPPLPEVTVTVTVTVREAGIVSDVLVIPVGSFIRVLSFAVYVVYIVRTIKHFTPEF